MVEVTGLITREIKYGDSSRIVTVITRELGRISVLAGGVRAGRSGHLAATQLFTYADFTLFLGRSKGLYKLNAAEVKEAFGGLRTSLTAMAYASYFCEIANTLVQENHPEPEQLSLLLNALYFLEKASIGAEQIKAVYEFRTLALQGVLPPLAQCAACGEKPSAVYAPQDGRAYCVDCAHLYQGEKAAVGREVLRAATYIAEAEPKRIFAFQMADEAIRNLSLFGEYCIELHIEKHLKTLDYLQKIRALEEMNDGSAKEN